MRIIAFVYLFALCGVLAHAEHASFVEPNKVQRWVKFTRSLNEGTKENWRKYLAAFQGHNIKPGAWLQEHWQLAVIHLGEVAWQAALEEWKKEESPTGKYEKCWRGIGRDPHSATLGCLGANYVPYR